MDLTGKVIDFADDSDGSLIKQAADEGHLPEFVASANIPEEAKAYAYVGRDVEGRLVRKFALDSKPEAWLSALYFLKHGHVFPKNDQRKIASNIKAACHMFELDIPGLLAKVAAGRDHLVPEAISREIDDSMYACGTGATRRYPLFDEGQIKRACSYFEENYRFMEPAERREFSQRVLARASTVMDKTAGFEVKPIGGHAPDGPAFPLPELMCRYAGELVSEMLPFAFKDRFARLEEGSEKWAALGVLWDNRGSFTIEKMAQALEGFDREVGFDRLWDKAIPDPYLSVCGFSKVADGDEVLYNENGMQMTGTMLRGLLEHPDRMQGLFEPDLLQQFAQNPMVIFQSLPAPEKQAIAERAIGQSQDAEAHTYPGSMSPGGAQ